MNFINSKVFKDTLKEQFKDFSSKRFNIKFNDINSNKKSKKDLINEQIKKQNLWTTDLETFFKDRNGETYESSTCTGNKKALFVGINYYGTSAQLSGCINDVKNVSELVCKKYGFKNCLYLTDENPDEKMKPTYNNIINGMKWLVNNAKAGDSLFFHYSGHGGTAGDSNNSNSDELDGFDETILPVDYAKYGQIVDDVIYENLVEPLPKGCRLTAVFDSCHSGTVMDLPFTYQCDGNIEAIDNDVRKDIFRRALEIIGNLLIGNTDSLTTAICSIFDGNFSTSTTTNSNTNQEEIIKKRRHEAEVIQFSGCKDNQTSADAKINNMATGAMSYALISVLSQNKDFSYTELLTEIRSIMIKNNFTQIPQLSTSHPMNMNDKFIM
ncbi:caspase domain-containing protein [Neocallimastix sp. 'constans']|jgi:hypothetical protein